MRRGPHVLHVAILVAGVGLACAAATAVSPTETAGESVLFHPSVLGTYAAALTVACTLLPEDRPSLARAVSASGLRLDVARRDLLVDAACTAGTARH